MKSLSPFLPAATINSLPLIIYAIIGPQDVFGQNPLPADGEISPNNQ